MKEENQRLKDVMTDNELIAEFMGEPMTFTHDMGHQVIERKLNYEIYYNQWSNLMPVIEKIQNMPSHNVEYSSHRNQLMGITIGAPIRVIYSKVVTFIKWYNKQK